MIIPQISLHDDTSFKPHLDLISSPDHNNDDAPLFEADVLKKPSTRAAFGFKSWDARRLRLFRDCLRYGTMAKGEFTEKPEKGPGKSPLPINGAVEYDAGQTKNGAEITMRFFDGNGHGAPVATKTFQLESTARRSALKSPSSPWKSCLLGGPATKF